MARIGIFGGTFNPPHLGHVQAMREFHRALQLDQILMIPDALPPHKTLPAHTPPSSVRLQLCRLAVQKLDYVTVSDLELRRPGVSYTADTLQTLRAIYPNDTLVLLMGSDMFLSFHSWRQPEAITACASLCVAQRSDLSAKQREALLCQKAYLEKTYGAQVSILENDWLELSSSEARRLLRFGCAGQVLPESVLQAIETQGLYGLRESWQNLSFDALCAASLELHAPQRRAHAQGCCELARKLALRWNLPADAAARAGILHDVTKALQPEHQLQLCQSYGIELAPETKENPQLYHAVTGAAAAKAVFGETEQVCRAIRYHTTGRAGMSELEQVLYLADLLEPNRDFPGVDALRRLAMANLQQAMLQALRQTIAFLEEKHAQVHPDSRAALAFFAARQAVDER